MKKRILTLVLALSLASLQLAPALAADPIGGPPAMPDGAGGPGGPAAAGQEFGTYDEIRAHAGILAENGEIVQLPTDSDFSGEISLDPSGEITANRVSGLLMKGSAGGNGLAITMGSETDVFTIGGEETPYTVDGTPYNTVIRVDAGNGNNDVGYEAVYGVGVGYATGELRVENSYIASEGPRSTPVYAFSTSSPSATSLVVEHSTLIAHSDEVWMPPFKLLSGGARATLLMTRNNSWFYGSHVESNNWGAVSQDSVDAMTYMVNSDGIATEGGYGTYLTYGMRLYGSDLYGGQYGVFMCGSSDILTDTGAAAVADADAMKKSPDFKVDTDRVSHVAAPFNALVVHNSLPDKTMVAKAVFRNSVLSTRPEDLPASVTPMPYDDDFFMPGVDILGSGDGCGAAYFFNKNLYGSLALIRSMNADLTFDNTETHPANGVLVQSVVTYDPPSASGYLTPEETVPGISVAFENGSYAGDILHEDYQRAMNIRVEDSATLSGRIVSGTWAAWNDLWSEENLTEALKSDGYTPDFFENDHWVEDVQTNLVLSQDSVYDATENMGAALTVSGTWTVTGDSSLKALTIEDGGSVTVPEGCTMRVYAGCDSSNSLLCYDDQTGTEVTDLTPGTYENVVIRVEGSPETATEEVEASSVLPEATPEVTMPAETKTPAPSAAPTETTAESGHLGPLLAALVGCVALIVLGAFGLWRRGKRQK